MSVNSPGTDPIVCPAQPPASLSAQFVTAAEFASILRISRRTLFRLRARGDLPAPVSVSTNIVRWRACDVRAYLDALAIRKPRRRR